MSVLTFRRRPRWVRAVVAVIAFMRLHYADRRQERQSQTVRRAYYEPKQSRLHRGQKEAP
ncbi:hypothetical protein BAN20980_04609 [Burkholderia anthina]|uniref:Uncharacterized protein n=1 Tax=Burkholderia anthina TaxID=179879 RepID=A0A6P2GF03_9BURK|nr:hypothetical protein BAN20980_04609 [Burkholderia anthina]